MTTSTNAVPAVEFNACWTTSIKPYMNLDSNAAFKSPAQKSMAKYIASPTTPFATIHHIIEVGITTDAWWTSSLI
jgi:hypothetical protein